MTIKPEHLPITTLGHDDIRETVRAINARFLLDYWSEKERNAEFPQEYFDEFLKAGFTTMTVPEEYGGGGATISQAAAMLRRGRSRWRRDRCVPTPCTQCHRAQLDYQAWQP